VELGQLESSGCPTRSVVRPGLSRAKQDPWNEKQGECEKASAHQSEYLPGLELPIYIPAWKVKHRLDTKVGDGISDEPK
jgi:hypothetical protein